MEFVNLTPHAIRVQNNAGEVVTFPPSGTIARVGSFTASILPVGGFTVDKVCYTEVENLPPPKDGVCYIVSGLVLGHCESRRDVVGPRTDSTAIRNGAGHIDYVVGFSK